MKSNYFFALLQQKLHSGKVFPNSSEVCPLWKRNQRNFFDNVTSWLLLCFCKIRYQYNKKFWNIEEGEVSIWSNQTGIWWGTEQLKIRLCLLGACTECCYLGLGKIWFSCWVSALLFIQNGYEEQLNSWITGILTQTERQMEGSHKIQNAFQRPNKSLVTNVFDFSCV